MILQGLSRFKANPGGRGESMNLKTATKDALKEKLDQLTKKGLGNSNKAKHIKGQLKSRKEN